MGIESILTKIGGFGRYQRQVYFLLCLYAIPCAWHAIASVFIFATTDHWCSVSDVSGVNCAELSLSDAQCTELKKNLTIPYEIKDSQIVYAQCLRYESEAENLGVYSVQSSGFENVNNDSVWAGNTETCSQWEYDHTQYKSTAV